MLFGQYLLEDLLLVADKLLILLFQLRDEELDTKLLALGHNLTSSPPWLWVNSWFLLMQKSIQKCSS